MHGIRTAPRLFSLLAAVCLTTGCATPVAVRGLSAALVQTQHAYAASLQGYFAAVENFADAQVSIADLRMDEITAEMNRQFARRAGTGLTGAATADQRQQIIDQLVHDVNSNTSADLPLKRKIGDAAALLKQKDRELEAAYQVILAASEKLDQYIQLKKVDETVINQLLMSVGLNSQKIAALVDAITAISQDLIQTIAKAQP